ncbi:hypothetical protein FRC03_008486 [Tulasnella sp. 419]|nr:hypothetical protein FRC02_009192 [Tulasnella sp. 418]KAG8968133.1 hypothetical protein FRC03_008486 [Tulasnella sp. 419]
MGKNWYDQKEIIKDTKIYAAWVLVLAGVAAWDVLSTFGFDWSIIRGKRKWRWPMVLYFICRLCLILHIFAFAFNLNAISKIPCQEVVWISKVTDAVGTCCSSIILLLRTVAVWHGKKYILFPLIAMSVAQIILWCQTFRYSVSVWSDQRQGCQVVRTAPIGLIVAVFSYTMAFDFVIMVLCTFRLYKSRNHGGIGALLFRDGIAYFIAAFAANLLQATMAGLGLNPVMNIICLPFALVVSAIAATRVFRHVFTLYDDFHNSSSGATGSVSANIGSGNKPGTSGIKLGRGRGYSANQGSHNDAYSLGDMRTGRTVEIHTVVDIESRFENAQEVQYPATNKTMVIDEDAASFSTSDERKGKI